MDPDFIYHLPEGEIPTSQGTSGLGNSNSQQPTLTTDDINGMIATQLRTQTERMQLVNGSYQSQNYITGTSGWMIDALGNCEFQNGIFRGNISAATGTIGGFNLNSTQITATGLVIDSSVPSITVGTGANAITLNGSTGTINSHNGLWTLNGNGTTSGLAIPPQYIGLGQAIVFGSADVGGVTAANNLYFSALNGTAIHSVALQAYGSLVKSASGGTTSSSQSSYCCSMNGFVYYSYFDGSVTRLGRLDANTLANAVSPMTGSFVSSVAFVFCDGTFVYAFGSGTTVQKYSISGTSFSNVGTITLTGCSSSAPIWCDGTNIYQFFDSNTIKKWALAGGSPTVITTYAFDGLAGSSSPACIVGAFGNTEMIVGVQTTKSAYITLITYQ